MALRKAGISLTIEGQAAYKAGITDINREMRLLAQESKLAVAQLGTQASRQATYTTEMDNYSKRIEVATGKTKVLASRQKELPGIQNQLSKSLKTTNAAYQDSANKTERLKNNYEQMSQALGRNHEATQEAKKSYQDSKAETKLLGDEVKSLEKSFAATDKELKNIPFSLNQAELASQQLRNEAQKLHEEYRNAGGRLADTADKFRGFGDTLTRTGDVMKGVGSVATKYLTAPLLIGGAAAIKASIDFESAFAGVKKTVDEVYDANGQLVISYEDLSQGIRDMAKELPATTTEISNVAESAGQLGIQTENVLAFSKTMIDMGESTNLAATDAATALARFANITGMSQDKFSNLGSAIVDLGNNFATTEAEIVNMALRLAGAGSQIGLSEADILGLSTALSSVGIEAEMGGSAFSKVMIQMQLAASKGGQKLEDFAHIAGMSAADFKTAFETDAVGAIGAFVEGLGNAEEKGTTAIELLDEMGISEVRLRDALLRAGNASDLFSEAIGTSNKAFEENTALTEEASKRYETTESKLRILKNQVTDTAIEFGGPLVDALRDGLTAAQPLIEGAGDLARSFSEMDEESQQAIIKLGLFALAGGPVLSMLGNITGGLGTVSSGIGSLVQGFGKLTTPKLISDTSLAFGTVTTGATTSATQVSALTGMIGGLPVVLGIAGAAMLGYTAWKVWGEDAWNAAQRTKEWGTDVGETVGTTLDEIKGFSESATGQFSLMAQGLGGNTEEMSANFASMGEVIESSLKDRISKLDELIEGLPDTVRVALTEILEEEKKQAETSLAIVEENNARITEIRENASKHNREISINEAQIISSLSKESNEAFVNSMKISQEEKKTILDAMNGDVQQATQEEARIWAQSLAEQRREQKDHFAEQKKDYIDAFREMGYSEDFIREQELVWDKANEATTRGIDEQLATIAEKYPEIANEISFYDGQMIIAGSETAQGMVENNQRIIDSARNLSEQVAAFAERNAEKVSWQAKGVTDLELQWNDIVLDTATGEIKTNVREAIVEAAASNQEWNTMKFMLHDADLNSNAKTMIGEAAIANDYWDGMVWEEKEAVLQDDFSITMYQALEESGKWNELTLPEKTAFLYSNTPEIMAQTMFDLGLWDEYQAEIKNLNADNYSILNAISQSETALAEYNALPPELKSLLAEDPSTLTFEQSKQALEQYNNVSPEIKELLGQNSDVVSKFNTVESRISNYNQNVNPGPKKLHATSNVESVVDSAHTSLNGISGKEVDTYVNTIYRTFGSAYGSASDAAIRGITPLYNARGTNYHPGGPMVVNDQTGPTFKELVSFPDGRNLVPEGRNVLIPNAPRGTKVLKASLTKKKIPRYADGVGYNSSTLSVENDDHMLAQLIGEIKQLARSPITVELAIDGKQITKVLANPMRKEFERIDIDQSIISRGRRN